VNTIMADIDRDFIKAAISYPLSELAAALDGRGRDRPRRSRRKTAEAAERGTVEQASSILGLPVRTVQSRAARGELPGAAKFGRRWTFDLGKLRRLVREKERKTWQNGTRRADVTGGAIPSGAGLRSMAATSDGRFTQVTQRLRERAARPGKTG
jgi:hypothetical protein